MLGRKFFCFVTGGDKHPDPDGHELASFICCEDAVKSTVPKKDKTTKQAHQITMPCANLLQPDAASPVRWCFVPWRLSLDCCAKPLGEMAAHGIHGAVSTSLYE